MQFVFCQNKNCHFGNKKVQLEFTEKIQVLEMLCHWNIWLNKSTAWSIQILGYKNALFKSNHDALKKNILSFSFENTDNFLSTDQLKI